MGAAPRKTEGYILQPYPVACLKSCSFFDSNLGFVPHSNFHKNRMMCAQEVKIFKYQIKPLEFPQNIQ